MSKKPNKWDLQEACRRRGLSTSGTVAELEARLAGEPIAPPADEAHAAPEAAPPADEDAAAPEVPWADVKSVDVAACPGCGKTENDTMIIERQRVTVLHCYSAPARANGSRMRYYVCRACGRNSKKLVTKRGEG